MGRRLLLLHIIRTHKLRAHVLAHCWIRFLGVLGIFLQMGNPFLLLRQRFRENGVLYSCPDSCCPLLGTHAFARQSHTCCLSRQNRYRTHTEKEWCWSITVGALSWRPIHHTAQRGLIPPSGRWDLLISPFTTQPCTLLTNFNGRSWVTKQKKTQSGCHNSSISVQALSHLYV